MWNHITVKQLALPLTASCNSDGENSLLVMSQQRPRLTSIQGIFTSSIANLQLFELFEVRSQSAESGTGAPADRMLVEKADARSVVDNKGKPTDSTKSDALNPYDQRRQNVCLALLCDCHCHPLWLQAERSCIQTRCTDVTLSS